MTTRYIENLDEIKNKLDPESVLELLLPGKTKRSGQELRSSCPVHGGYGTENFSLNINTHKWCCHSKGCKGANLIDLYAQTEQIQFLDAAEKLATQFSIPIHYKKPVGGQSERIIFARIRSCMLE